MTLFLIHFVRVIAASVTTLLFPVTFAAAALTSDTIMKGRYNITLDKVALTQHSFVLLTT
jgi:hypothetical protein